MDLLLRHYDQFKREYNCSFYPVEQLPANKRTHQFFGFTIIVIGVAAELLYMLCVYGLWKQASRKNCCYRLMLIMAISEMLCLPVTCFISGYFSLTGRMFCNSPLFIYVSGIFGFACWATYCVSSVELAINRCLAFTHYYWIFDEWRQWIWLTLPLAYASLIFAFARTPIYNSIYGAWFFNPHLGYFSDEENTYRSIAQIGNNLSLSILLPTIYFLFYVHHSILSKGLTRIPKREYSLFLQIFILNIMLAFASLGYVIMQYIQLPDEIMYASHLGWIINQASPPIVYLTLNDTIRRSVFPSQRFKIGTISDTHRAKRSNSSAEA